MVLGFKESLGIPRDPNSLFSLSPTRQEPPKRRCQLGCCLGKWPRKEGLAKVRGGAGPAISYINASGLRKSSPDPGISLVVQWLKLYREHVGSIPCQGTKILHEAWHGQIIKIKIKKSRPESCKPTAEPEGDPPHL